MTSIRYENGERVVTGMREQGLAEWQAEGRACGFRFVCPACGHIAGARDFEALKADPQSAPRECIGRATGAGDSKQKTGGPCNWAAYGLLGTMGRGRMLVMLDGEKVEVFDFAPAAGGAKEGA